MVRAPLCHLVSVRSTASGSYSLLPRYDLLFCGPRIEHKREKRSQHKSERLPRLKKSFQSATQEVISRWEGQGQTSVNVPTSVFPWHGLHCFHFDSCYGERSSHETEYYNTVVVFLPVASQTNGGLKRLQTSMMPTTSDTNCSSCNSTTTSKIWRSAETF